MPVQILVDMKTRIILLSFLINFIVVNGQSSKHIVTHGPPIAVYFDPEKAAGKILTGIPLVDRKKADDYTEGSHWLLLWNFLNATLIALIFLFSGLSGWLKRRSFGISAGVRGKFSYISLYFILSYLLSLPLNIYQHFVREKQYRFLNQTFVQWLGIDLLKFMIEVVIIVPVFLLGYTILIRPIKNKLAYGIAIPIVFIVSANLWMRVAPDNLLNVILEYGILILSGFLLVGWVLNEIILRYGKRLRIENTLDIAALPLLVFLTTSYLFFLSPVINTIKRESELEATIYRLNTARKPDLFILSVLKSADHDKADPGYWEEVLFFDHPSLKKKILVAEIWKAENLILIPFFDIKGFGC